MSTWEWIWITRQEEREDIDDQIHRQGHQGFPERVTTKSATPASENLFDISENDPGKLLSEEQAQDFHHTVAQLLFLCMRARLDLKTADQS